MTSKKTKDLQESLLFQLELGADVAVNVLSTDKTTFKAESSLPAPQKLSKALLPHAELITHAQTQAQSAKTLDELRQVMNDFEGCDLKKTAQTLVFADGNPQARVMIVGEAPGADEDKQGVPFVGMSGQLFDRVFKAAGFDRTTLYISNIIPWRPPGNRPPTPQEIALCLPFIERHIELVAPNFLILAGGTAAKALLKSKDGIVKLRGKWVSYQSPGLKKPIETLATFHPAYLLRSPGQKKYVWQDFLALRQRVDELKK